MKSFIFISVLLCVSTVGSVQGRLNIANLQNMSAKPSGVDPDSIFFPSITLGLTYTQQLQAELDNHRNYKDLIGISAAVLTPTKGMWLGASGMSDPVEGDSIVTSMLFGIGSITKTFVSALILKLAEEDRLTLEDSLYQWLPNYQYIDSNITIRQLLNHTSGIDDYLNNNPAWIDSAINSPTRFWTPEDLFLTFLGEPSFPSGSRYGYSNTGYILLGMIIKEVTQSEVSIELRNRLLSPLNLNRTSLFLEDTLYRDLAHGWVDLDNDGTLDDLPYLQSTAFYSIFWTAGAILSTAEDITRWAAALYGGNVLSQPYLTEMLTISPPSKCGLGVFKNSFFNRDVWWHGGQAWGFESSMIYSPVDDISITVLVNETSSTGDVMDYRSILSKLLYIAIIYEYKLPIPVISTSSIYFGEIQSDSPSIDTTFFIHNSGVGPDTIFTSLHYGGADTNAMFVEPLTFELAPGDSQGITFTLIPSMLNNGIYRPEIVFDSKYNPDLGIINLKKQIEFNVVNPTGIAEESPTVPESFVLEQNNPNPFNPITTINYSLSKDSYVSIMVYNTLGQLVDILVSEYKSSGHYSVKWDASGLPTSIYLCKMKTNGYTATKKMFLQK